MASRADRLERQLGKAGATIVAHENTRLWLATDVVWPWNGQRFNRLPRIAQPNEALAIALAGWFRARDYGIFVQVEGNGRVVRPKRGITRLEASRA